MLGSLISAGASLLGGFMNRKEQRRINASNQAFSQKQFDALMDQSVTRRVGDARRAGVHPLFALGASVGSPGNSPFQGAASGALGAGVEAAGRAIGGATGRSKRAAQPDPVSQAQIRNLDAQTALTEAETLIAQSNLKRAEQEALSTALDVNTLRGTGSVLAPPALEAKRPPAPKRAPSESSSKPPKIAAYGGMVQPPPGAMKVEPLEEYIGEYAEHLAAAENMPWLIEQMMRNQEIRGLMRYYESQRGKTFGPEAYKRAKKRREGIKSRSRNFRWPLQR